MLVDINNALRGLPSEMMPALSGQNNPYAVHASAPRGDMRGKYPGQVGTAIGCLISAYKRNFGRNA